MNPTMRGLWLEAGRISYRDDLPLPQRQPDEVLIRVSLAGICNTDLELQRGYYPFTGVPGHEFVGVVVESETAGRLRQRAVAEINVPCGACDMCRRNMSSHCRHRTTFGIHGRNGTLAEFVAAPTTNLHPVPEGVPDEEAVFVEPLAAAFEVLEQVHIRSDDLVVVLGDGKLGLLIAQVVALCSGRVVAIGHHREKLDILRRRGIDTRMNGETLAGQADVVVECTGRQSGLDDALRLLRPRGQLVLKSTYAGLAQVDMSRLVVNEIQLVGSRCGPFEPALRALARGLVDVRSLIDSFYGLDAGEEAFLRAGARGALKVLLRP